MRIFGICARIAALLALAVLWTGALAEQQANYVMNDWDYVDGSIDATAGIPEDAQGALAQIRAQGVLRVATEPYWAPQEFIDPSLEGQARYVGADMELARLLAERMGVTLEIMPMDFQDVLTAVSEGQADLAISALAYTPRRASQVTLSKGYYFTGENAGSGLVIRAEDADEIRSIEDLAGRDIVAQRASLQELLMAEHVFNYRQFKRLPTIEDAYRALSEGQADAAALDIENAMTYIKENPDCGLALVPDVRFVLPDALDGDRVAAKKGELQLMYFVNGVIDELLASGQYQAWFDEYAEYAARLGL